MSDQVNIAAMTSPQAEIRLGELLADSGWASRLSSRDVQVHAEFDALNRKALGLDAAPSPVVDSAQTRLDKMSSDLGFGKSLVDGDPAAWRTLRSLTEAVANSAPTAAAPNTDSVTDNETRVFAASLRARVGDAATNEYLDPNHRYTPEEIAAATAMREQRLSDPDWVKRKQAGGKWEDRELALMSMVITKGTGG